MLDVINEPTAAALSYGFARLDGGGPAEDAEEVALVYDLGGGTVDVTIVELAQRRLAVVAIDGDHALGGADWDETRRSPFPCLSRRAPRRGGPV